jgi:hypothetical protein
MTLEAACVDRHEAIAALVLGELSKPEADALREHLAQCEGCRRLYDSMTTEEQAIVSAFDTLGRRGRDVQDSVLRRIAPRQRRFVVGRRIGILAAAAVVVVTTALVISILTRQTREEPAGPMVAESKRAPTHSLPSVSAPPRETEPGVAKRLFAARDVEGLMDLLAHGAPDAQIAAANYLAKIGDTRALDVLRRLRDSYRGDDPNNPFAAAIAEIQSRLTPQKEKPSVGTQQEPGAPVAPAAGQAVQTVTYAGTVRDQIGQPIEAVAVRSWFYVSGLLPTGFDGWEQVLTTDREGRFEIGPLPVADSRKHQLRMLMFEHPKYAIGWFNPYWGNRNMIGPKKLDIVLLEPTVFSGTVVDPNGEPIEGAIVEADLQLRLQNQFDYIDMDRQNGYAVRTNAAGEFSLRKIPTGTRLHLRVSKDGYVHYASREEFQGDMYPMRPGQDVQIELTPGATLRGRVLLHDQPYKKAGLGITAQHEAGYASAAMTDAEGRFEMTDLAPGRYTVTAEYESTAKEGLVCPLVTGLEIKSGPAAQTAELHLTEGMPVTVAVVDTKTGQPVPNEQVAATADTAFASQWTDEQGRCVLRLAAGQYKLGVKGWRDGKWAQFWKDVTVPENAKELSVSMEIAARPSIRGRLVDSRLMPLRGIVRIESEDPVTTSKDGAFACPEPWHSPWDVMIGYAIDETATLGRAFFCRPAGDPNTMEIVAAPLVTIVGRIVDAKGVGIDDVEPRLDIQLGQGRSQSARNDLWSVKVEKDGTFRFTGVPTGLPMKIFVEKPGLQGGVELPEFAPGGTIDAGDVVLKSLAGFDGGQVDWTGTLSGRVVNEGNEPMVGLTVHTSIGTQSFDDTTDLKGRYSLKGLPRGQKISGSVYADGYGHTMFQATIDGNDLDIRLFPQGWDLLNKPAPGLFVDKWINAEDITLERYRGKVVLLLLGVLLPKDPMELDSMNSLVNVSGSHALQVIAIHQRLDISWAGKVTEEDLRAFVAARGITFPLGIDAPVDTVRDLVGDKAMGNGAMYSLYDVKATPALYLIDKKGIVRISPQRNELDAWINRLLSEP